MVNKDHKCSGLYNQLILPPPPLKKREYAMKPSEMASLSNSRWQNCKERQNLTTNKRDIAETAKRTVRE